MDVRELHDRALAWFGERVKGVPDEAWNARTPCEEWDVRDLVNHNVSENWWAKELLEGRTIDEVGDRLEGDVLGEDPVEAYMASADAARRAAAQIDLDTPVDLSYGRVPARDYLDQRWVDLAVHGWDLAVATSQEERLPDDLAEAAWELMTAQREAVRQSGVFAEEVEVGNDAEVQTKLLGLLGRDRLAWSS